MSELQGILERADTEADRQMRQMRLADPRWPLNQNGLRVADPGAGRQGVATQGLTVLCGVDRLPLLRELGQSRAFAPAPGRRMIPA